MLGGKAKEWALGKLVADASCFPTMESMKGDLRPAIQHSAFLSRKKGHMAMLEYIQCLRHLISCITLHPMDMSKHVRGALLVVNGEMVI
ncbi:hypothetical protein PHMEG_00018012 [Phytophthora megakarya]|uniref:Retrotransposon gag domain-containing protein n=1 Tax=Phytophthora megakarya TaxID=4795 RepID=A0A225VV35_9STRA|nr:hypothetical protein PHMEG_00018012 [Phytophthora megakarya]